jgi:hypothetical protein
MMGAMGLARLILAPSLIPRVGANPILPFLAVPGRVGCAPRRARCWTPCCGFHRFDEELCRLGAGYVTVMAIVVAGEPPGHVHAM